MKLLTRGTYLTAEKGRIDPWHFDNHPNSLWAYLYNSENGWKYLKSDQVAYDQTHPVMRPKESS